MAKNLKELQEEMHQHQINQNKQKLEDERIRLEREQKQVQDGITFRTTTNDFFAKSIYPVMRRIDEMCKANKTPFEPMQPIATDTISKLGYQFVLFNTPVELNIEAHPNKRLSISLKNRSNQKYLPVFVEEETMESLTEEVFEEKLSNSIKTLLTEMR